MQFQEYPKWVTPKDGEPVLVHGADEEAKALGKSKSSVTSANDKEEAAGQAALDESQAREDDELLAKGTAITEEDMAKLADPTRRGPGRPRKEP
jgi:hypothetical protein